MENSDGDVEGSSKGKSVESDSVSMGDANSVADSSASSQKSLDSSVGDGGTGERTPGQHTSGGRGGIVTARGTGDGLIIRLDGRVDSKSVKDALYDFVMSRRSFLSGNEISFEWVGALPEDSLMDEIEEDLGRDFKIRVKSSSLMDASERRQRSRSATDQLVIERGRDVDKPLSLFGGIESLEENGESLEEVVGVEGVSRGGESHVTQSSLWDDADARVIYSTLRSGQKIETEHSLILVGDVNSGAEIIAGGDIMVLGTLRGVAHAGAYDETGGGRYIFALELRPTQLRIGMVISRGAPAGQQIPEIARVDGNLIVVEPYQSKNAQTAQSFRGNRAFRGNRPRGKRARGSAVKAL